MLRWGGLLLSCMLLLYNGQREAVMKALVQDGSDVPKKIIMKKTLGYGSPRSQKQTPEMKATDEEAGREKTEKNKIGQIPMTRVKLTGRGGETQLKACGLIGKQSELCRARRHRERSLSGGETCFSVRRSAALRPALLLLLLHRLHPALTQRAHYNQCRALDPRRHSYEACLKPLRRAHSPQCE